jgi:outer membrane lipoprotein carrier protein
MLIFAFVFAAHAVLVQKVESYYQGRSPIYVEFDQKLTFAATKVTQIKNGRLWLGGQGKIRWETLEPEPELLVSDGKTYWFYTPPFSKGDRGQVLIRTAGQVQTDLLSEILRGSLANLEKKGHRVSETAKEVVVTPKPKSAGDLKEIHLTVDNGSGKIEGVRLVYLSGNLTQIIVKKLTLKAPVPPGGFKFVPDRNTDIIAE